MRENSKDRNERGFTLIELLVVIAILGVLAAAVTIVVNPVELLAQARDAERISDIDSLNKSLSLYQTQNPGTMPGSTSTEYVSLLDTASSTCGDLFLPALSSGWGYGCSGNPSRTDMSGWIPVNLAGSISSLPVDPTNSASSGLYYTYTVSGNQYELTAIMESHKYRTKEEAYPPLPSYPVVFAEGTSLSISPLFNPSGMIGYWPFDDGSGTTADDLSGNGNNGVLINGPSWIAGEINDALSFNGTSSYVFPPSLGIPPPSVSISVWIKPNPAGGVVMSELGQAAINSGWHDSQIEVETNNTIKVCVWTGGLTCLTAANNITYGSWYYIVLSYDASTHTLKGYENGALVNSVPATKEYPGTLHYGIGPTDSTNGGDGSYFSGLIDDVRIYSRALSAAEVSALYDAERQI